MIHRTRESIRINPAVNEYYDGDFTYKGQTFVKFIENGQEVYAHDDAELITYPTIEEAYDAYLDTLTIEYLVDLNEASEDSFRECWHDYMSYDEQYFCFNPYINYNSSHWKRYFSKRGSTHVNRW